MLCELDVLKRCPVCGHTTVQLTRIDKNDNISTVRKNNQKAEKFLAKLKGKILYEEKNIINPKLMYGKFYLYYNEYGVKKRCYSNFKNLKIGLNSLI